MSKMMRKVDDAVILAADSLTSVQSRESELLLRLSAALKLLEETAQEDEPPQHFLPLASQLVQPWLMNHRGQAVKTFVACCISEVLRLYVPDPPYPHDTIKDIFRMFFVQMRLLRENDANFERRYSLLDSLATLKMPLLLVETCRADDDRDRDDSPLLELFNTVFEITLFPGSVSHPEPFMIDIITSVIMELDEITPTLLDSLLKRLVNKENNRSFVVAQEVVRVCSERLLPVISELLTNSGAASQSEFSDRKSSQELIYQLGLVDPGLLLYILPAVCRDLQMDELQTRVAAVELLGSLFASSEQLCLKYHKNYIEFLQRFHDKEPSIRSKMVGFGGKLLYHAVTVAEPVVDELRKRVTDLDHAVRFEVVKTVSDAACKLPTEGDARNGLSHLTADLLYETTCRVMDRKSNVQLEAIKGMSQAFALHVPALWESGDAFDSAPSATTASTLSKLMHVPGVLVTAYCECESPFIQYKILQALDRVILPDHLSPSLRGRGLLAVFATFTVSERKAFAYLLKDKRNMQQAVGRYLDVRAEKDTVSSHSVAEALLDIAQRLPNSEDALEHLQVLHNDFKDKLIFANLEKMADPYLEVSESRSASADIIGRVARDKKLTTVMRMLLRFLSTETIDVSVSSAILHDVEEGQVGLLGTVDKGVDPPTYRPGVEDAKVQSLQLLTEVVRLYPGMCVSALDTLLAIGGTNPVEKARGKKKGGDGESLPSDVFVPAAALKLLSTTVSHIVSSSFPRSGVSAEAMSSIERQFPSSFTSALVKLASTKHSFQVKHSAKMLSTVLSLVLACGSSFASTSAGGVCQQLVRDVSRPAMLSSTHPSITFTLTILSQFALTAPAWLLMNRGQDTVKVSTAILSGDSDDEPTQLAALMFLGNLARGFSAAASRATMVKKPEAIAEAKKHASAAIQFAFALLESGSLSGEGKACVGRLVLKLYRFPLVEPLVQPLQWLALAQLAQDEDTSVCVSFTTSLVKGLNRTVLPIRFIAVPMLALNHAYSHNKAGLTRDLRAIVRKYRLRHQSAVASAATAPCHPSVLYRLSPVASLPFAVHLLAHLPQFPAQSEWQRSSEIVALSRMPQQLLAVLLDALVFDDTGSTQTGLIATMLHILQSMRAFEDACDPGNGGMHIAGELATRILKSKIKDVSSVAGAQSEVYLPPSLFKSASSAGGALASFASKLPDTVLPESPELGRSPGVKRKSSGGPSPMKRVSGGAGGGPKARKLALQSSDDEEDQDVLSDGMESERGGKGGGRKGKGKRGGGSAKENKGLPPKSKASVPSPAPAALREPSRRSARAAHTAPSYRDDMSSELEE